MKELLLIICLLTLLTIIVSVLLQSCVVPSRIIETYTTDSAGKTTKVVQKIYDNNVVYQASSNVMTYPLWYNYNSYHRLPKIVIPITQRIQVPQYHIHH